MNMRVNTRREKMYLLGIDIGTSSAKCVLVDRLGKVRAAASRSYPLETPRPGWAEQDAGDWARAAFEGIRQLLDTPGISAADIDGVSFSGQMHGLVALDRAGNVIRKPFLWCDQRTQAQCDEIEALAGGREALTGMTNNVMLTGYTGGKLLWLKQVEPEHYAAMTAFQCPKDYVRFRLTGEILTDASEASGTGFFDTKNRRWCRELIRAAGLDEDVFPPVVESVDHAGSVTEEAAELTGLLPGTPCFAGGGDAVVQSFASGLLKAGTVGTVIGTSGNVSMGFEEYTVNPGGKLQMFCSVTPGSYMSFGATQTAGGAFRWFRDQLAADVKERAAREGRNAYDLLGEIALQSPPGANGVVFAPYLSGERCPYPDPDARGVLYGLSLNTRQCDIVRAVMEGIVFSLSQIVDIYRSFTEVSGAVASGGGAGSSVFLQMQADIFDLPVRTVSAAEEGGAYGAALIAGLGLGVFASPEEALGALRTEKQHYPVPESVRLCRNTRRLYQQIYPALKDVYKLGAT
ncbi:MAG: xylulokinase [Clostridiales bacterium]|nr:xylulokinase [Clostridiales bacterium]